MSKQDLHVNLESPKTEPAPTPFVSAADQHYRTRYAHDSPPERYQALEAHARHRVDRGARGSGEDHLQGLLGEDALAHYLGIAERLDTTIYDNGDGGVDLTYRGATIDVKTVGRHEDDPALTVDAYEPLQADYYVLARRTGPNRCRLVGYAPRIFVANDEPRQGPDGPYHRVPKEYLFPLPRKLR